MKKLFFNFLISASLTFLLIFFWNIFVLTLIPEVGIWNFRLSLSSLLVVFLVLERRGNWLPWMILYVEICESLYSVSPWGQHVLADLCILILAHFLKSFINVKKGASLFFLVITLLFVRYFISSLLWMIKMEYFEQWWPMLLGYLPQVFIMGFLSIPLFKIFKKIWKEKSLESDLNYV